MKTLIRHRNQILFGLLVMVLGFSKSWFMTATPLIHTDMASDQTTPVAHVDDGIDPTNQTVPSAPGAKDGKQMKEQPTPSAKTLAQAKQQCEAKAKTAAATKACNNLKINAETPKITGTNGKVTKKNKLVADDVQTVEHDDTPKFDKKTEALLNSAESIPFSKKFNVTQDGVTTTYQIEAVQGLPTQAQTLVNGQLTDVTGTTLVASIKCITCGSEETLTSNAQNVGDFLKDIATQMAGKGSDYAIAQKAEKKRQNDIKNCKIDEDGNKLGDEDGMICEANKAMDGADRGEKLDALRETVGDDLDDMIASGPSGVKKARQYIRDLLADVPGDSDTREYLKKFSKFATDYGKVASYAKQSSLACSQATPQCLQQRQIFGNEITQVEQPYVYDGGHSWGTQDYLNDFSQILLNYGQQATVNPFNAYNNFYNGATLGRNNGLGFNGLNNGMGLNAMNGPPGFQPTGIGPNGMTTAPMGYNGINNSLLNNSPNSSLFNMQQATRFGNGYTPGGTNGFNI